MTPNPQARIAVLERELQCAPLKIQVLDERRGNSASKCGPGVAKR
jgi:hypothetical protein